MDMKINKNHLLFLVLTCLIILSSCSDSLSDTTDERLRYWISTLASDDFEGRAPGTEGGKLTKNFISKTLEYKLLPHISEISLLIYIAK